MGQFSAEVVAQALKDARGSPSGAARRLGCHRATVHRYLAAHEECRAAQLESREELLDDVEATLYNKALSGDTACMIFFLKTQGRHRGYTERSDAAAGDMQELALALEEALAGYPEARSAAAAALLALHERRTGHATG